MKYSINWNEFFPRYNEKNEIEESINNINWDNMERGEVVYFSSGSESAGYDFIVVQLDDEHVTLDAVEIQD